MTETAYAEAMGAAADAIDAARARVQDTRIRLAQLRDGSLTQAEQIAICEVYGEFGR